MLLILGLESLVTELLQDAVNEQLSMPSHHLHLGSLFLLFSCFHVYHHEGNRVINFDRSSQRNCIMGGGFTE